jgi:tetratricopeptide (TPR) repeat protein
LLELSTAYDYVNQESTPPSGGSTDGPSEEAIGTARVAPDPKSDRKSAILFVAGTLAGLALGVPTAYGLFRAGAEQHVEAPSKPVEVVHSALLRLIPESQAALANDQPQRALDMLLEAERIDPKNAVVQNNLCVAYIGLGRHDAAIAACNAALVLDKNFQLARNNLTWAQSVRAKAAPAVSAAP